MKFSKTLIYCSLGVLFQTTILCDIVKNSHSTKETAAGNNKKNDNNQYALTMRLTTMHNGLFGTTDLLLKEMKEKDLKQWSTCLLAIGDSVRNANYQDLIQCYNNLLNVNEKLLLIINTVYSKYIKDNADIKQNISVLKEELGGKGTQFAETIDQEIGQIKVKLAPKAGQMEKIVDPLVMGANNMLTKTEESLKKIKPWKKSKKDVFALVNNLALSLHVTLDKIVKDLDKLGVKVGKNNLNML
jgi:hypothetical protein